MALKYTPSRISPWLEYCKLRSMRALLSFLILILPLVSQAAETDDFTHRNDTLADMAEVINQKANQYLRRAVVRANAEGNCDEEALYTKLQDYFANHTRGKLTQYINSNPEVQKIAFPISQSVYRDWSVSDGLLLGINQNSPSALAFAPLVRVGEEMIGSDKFEHMFGMGFDYFQSHYQKSKPLAEVLNRGSREETLILGGTIFTTGVYSYADLSANFNGMRFWNHVLQKNDDVLGVQYNAGPYVACRQQKFQVVKPIDFRTYIDASMNESVNCSDFATHAGLRKFQTSLKRLGNLTCPLQLQQNLGMQNKYNLNLGGNLGSIASKIINSGTNGTVFFKAH